MKRFCLVISLFILITIPGCSMLSKDEMDFPVLPVSAGFMVEKSEERDEALESQGRVKVVNSWGSIILKPWEGSGIKLKATKRVQGLRSKAVLFSTMEGIDLKVEKKPYTVVITVTYPEKTPLLVGQGTQLEVWIPEEVFYIEAEARTGNINAEGFKKLDDINLSTTKGSISIADVITREYDLEVGTGNLAARKLEGKGRVEINRGSTALDELYGDLEHRGISGNTVISGYKGKLSCNVSAGSIVLVEAEIAKGSSLYSTSGKIVAEKIGFKRDGSYSFKTANGQITLTLPENASFVMNAKTINGYIESDFVPEGASVSNKKLPKVLKGAIGSGGPEIILNTMSGKIEINKIK